MQAQDYGMAKWSVGQRAEDLMDADIDAALAEGTVVRTHVLRPTWHFVATEDVRWMLRLTGPLVQKQVGPRYRELGLDTTTRSRTEGVIASALADGKYLTRDEISRALTEAGIDTSGQRLPHLILHCELEALIGSGGLSGKQQTYALLDERIRKHQEFDRDDAMLELTRRYLQSHGPATVQDLRWWSSLPVADIKKSLAALGSDVRSELVGEMTFWSLAASQTTARAAVPRALLLQAYDEVVVGYTTSRYFGDPRAARARAAWRDRTVPTGVVLVSGGVAGHWRRTMKRDSVAVEVLLYDESTPTMVRALQTAARQMGRFLGRKASVEVK